MPVDQSKIQRGVLASGCLVVGAIVASSSVQAGERRLARAELNATRGGATIDIVVPHDVKITGQKSSQPIMGFEVTWPQDEEVWVYPHVNGLKTGELRVASSEFAEYKEIRVPIQLPHPAKANIKLMYCTQSLINAGASCPADSYGGDAVRDYEFSKSMKVAGVNFWNLRSGSSMLSYDPVQVKSAVSEIDSDTWESRTDGILAGTSRAYGTTVSDALNCWNTPWGFTHRKTSTIEMPSTKCFTPTIAIQSNPSLGPDPLCPEFDSVVDAKLANELDYVNVVAVDYFTVWTGSRYERAIGVEGAHTPGKRWFIVRRNADPTLPPKARASNFAKTIVHEWGHQVGLPHSTGPECDPFVAGSALGIMCGDGLYSRGVTRTFCDAVYRYTGTKNLNPVK